MFKIGDYLVCRKEVCRIVEIKQKYFNNQDYFILQPVSDASLTIQMPIDSNQLRCVLSKKEVDAIIKKIPFVDIITTDNDKIMENVYKELLSTNKHEDLVKIIKTTFARNQERMENNKKPGDKDNSYFILAENYLYNEFAVVLGITYDEVKIYVEEKVKKILV